ncbi:UDP-2,3-diacylglucosamine diphosphatase [Alkalilimnicola ehrlichii]|uniref:UDP-2,3-diacylglucosamine diphosphatase n=1 Tax=Alkalilimnicola ehrlichii TaxID=351052 RepID=UPI003BA2A72D
MTAPQAPILFIADLHLDERRPEIVELFLAFLQRSRDEVGALYILGDLFEAWLGDDTLPAEHPVLAGMRDFAASGTPLYVMRGNRDFLMGEGFAELSGCTLLPDEAVIDLFGEPTLLLHGDSLCTDDPEYQAFRSMVLDPKWQAEFLALPREERLAKAREARDYSQNRNSTLPDDIMDVNPEAVQAAMERHAVRRMIHGHTHRPAVHTLEVAGEPAERIVLGDWFDQGSVLRCTPDECRLEGLTMQDLQES